MNSNNSTLIPVTDIETSSNETDLEPLESSTFSLTPIMTALNPLIIPTFAMLSSLSLPLFIIAVQEKYAAETPHSLEQKIFQPLLPYLGLIAFRSWFLWNKIGHRINGKPDEHIRESEDSDLDDPWHVLAALIANTSSITNAFLLTFILLPEAEPALLWSAAMTLGFLSYTTDLLTDVPDAFRKHTEQKRPKTIKPFFKQKFIEPLFNKKVLYFAVFLREVLPIVNGLIRAQVTTQTVAALLEDSASEKVIMLVTIPLGLITYSASAYFAKFDLIQLKDNLEGSNQPGFIIENSLSRASSAPLRAIGQISSGQILINLLNKVTHSVRTSTNIVYVFASLGLMSLLLKALHEYVSSPNTALVEKGDEGLVLSYYLGNEEAIKIAPTIEIANACIAVSLGALGMFAQTGTLHKYTSDTYSVNTVNQVFPEVPNETLVYEFSP